LKDETLKDETIQEETTEIYDEETQEEPAGVREDSTLDLEAVNLDLQNRLEEAQANAAEYLDGWQRARAEFANARKRMEKDRVEAYQKASVDHTRQLLPVLDDFDRALEVVPATIANDDWYEGLILVRRKLQALLEALNVTPIEAIGEPFDPNVHEALQLVAAENVDSGTVVEVVQKGYRIGDTIIRPSLVNVAQ